jgi:hypothetical protein
MPMLTVITCVVVMVVIAMMPAIKPRAALVSFSPCAIKVQVRALRCARVLVETVQLAMGRIFFCFKKRIET